ncbi:MAG TPA: hypothetical protein VIN07_13005 [Flavipsychrobacter sp.]
MLLFFVLFHWVQVFASILYADFMEQTIDVLFNSTDTQFLFTMTFIQLIVVAFFLQLFVKSGGKRVVNLELLKTEAAKISTRNVIIGYFVSLALLPALSSLFRNSPSALQLLSSFSIIKHVFTGLLIFIILLKKTDNRWLIIGILVLDFILSFASFFSDFKTILIMVIMIYYTVNPYLRKTAAYRMIPIIFVLVAFFSFWSFVKGEYRNFLNQGAGQQVVNVSNTEALTYLFERLGDFNAKGLRDGLTLFIDRAQYMERYSEVYARVPSVVPHQDGADLAQALEFLLIPRFINEDKGMKDASQRTSYYTGKKFSTAAQGTSISMGYFCDLYIDYGLYLMIIPLLGFMAIVGYVYKIIMRLPKYNILFIYGLLVGTFLTLGTFESDSIYFLGTIRNNLVFLLLGYFTFFRALHKFIFVKTK